MQCRVSPEKEGIPVQTLIKITHKFVGEWLSRAVDLHDEEQSYWPIANPRRVPVEFHVLTPDLQRSIDQCA